MIPRTAAKCSKNGPNRVTAVRRLTLSAATVLLLALIAQPAYAADSHLFDPTLSLTGDCFKSSLDSVSDPGCPGGPHPPKRFTLPRGVAVDASGNIYVADNGKEGKQGAEGRVDIFDATGHFITEVLAPNGATRVAVDSNGVMYVKAGGIIERYDPTTYQPQSGKIAYIAPPTVAVTDAGESSGFGGIAINPANDRLFLATGNRVREYGSATEENKLLDNTIGAPSGGFPGLVTTRAVAIDATHQRIYVSDGKENSIEFSQVRIFSLAAPHELIATIDGSTTPAGKFFSSVASLSIAPDEATGNFFVDDIEKKNRVYEFTESGQYVSKIDHGFEANVIPTNIAYVNGAGNPNQGYLFVPSGESECCNLFAFEPNRAPEPPVVESVSFTGVTQSEVVLKAAIVPHAPNTTYTFEYTTAQSFAEVGFADAIVVGAGELGNGKNAVTVSAPIFGLAPGAGYRFRVSAVNSAGSDEGESGFRTYDAYARPEGCINQSLRIGASASLPDCRAYELVTPANTGGHTLFAPGRAGAGEQFPTPPVSASGERVAFLTLGGSIPGIEGAGNFNGDGYLSTRGAGGWQTASSGPSGGQTSNPFPGGLSADLGYMAWTAIEAGTLPIDSKATNYIRYPDGSFQLVGQGTLAIDPIARPIWISENATHIIFSQGRNAVGIQLEPDAPPTGTNAIYDRTPDGVNHVVSLLPGDITPAAGQNAVFQGVSADGSAVAFTVGDPQVSPLYLRVDNSRTVVAAASGGTTFAGLSANGRYLYYLSGGDLFRFDAAGEETIQITSTHDATVVNVSSSGAAAYFLSPSVLGAGTNPSGEEPQAGKENLYLWDGATPRFVATVTKRDVDGEPHPNGGGVSDGLGLWLDSLEGRPAASAARTSPSGTALLFQSRADLTGDDQSGKAQIYRYDSVEEALDCLSCNPTQAQGSSDATLLSVEIGSFDGAVATSSIVPNLSSDGQRAFFESSDRLALADTDGVQDVYEWEANGRGSCTKPGGCVYLISSGRSSRPNYLYGVSASGDDVFFVTADLLLPSDPNETPSIYDARVDGGFPSDDGAAAECLGEACQPAAKAPSDPTPSSASFAGAGNSKPGRKARCPKGKRKARVAGKRRCVSQHKKNKKSNKRAGAKRRAAR